MSDHMKAMQSLRKRHEDRSERAYIALCSEIMKALGYPLQSDDYDRIMDMISEYGRHRGEGRYWDGAINESMGLTKYRMEDMEAREYAEAAAAAGQQELLEPKPDHPHDVRCDGFNDLSGQYEQEADAAAEAYLTRNYNEAGTPIG